MKKLLFTFLLLLAAGVCASSFNGEILCDPVNEINSLIISENTVVKKSFHYINGVPVQCLRIFSFAGNIANIPFCANKNK